MSHLSKKWKKRILLRRRWRFVVICLDWTWLVRHSLKKISVNMLSRGWRRRRNGKISWNEKRKSRRIWLKISKVCVVVILACMPVIDQLTICRHDCKIVLQFEKHLLKPWYCFFSQEYLYFFVVSSCNVTMWRYCLRSWLLDFILYQTFLFYFLY